LPPLKRETADRLLTGSDELDTLTGGGWVKYGVNEITGDPKTGKSRMTYITIARTLRAGMAAVLIDTENGFSVDYASQYFNLTSEKFALVQNIGAEACFELITKLSCNELSPLIVLDTWDALAFGMDKEVDLSALDGDSEIARMRGWGFSSFLKRLHLATATLLVVSHKPVQIGHVEKLPAYTHHCDMRVQLVDAGSIRLRAKVVGGWLGKKTSAERVW
jgi:hypothetical protein